MQVPFFKSNYLPIGLDIGMSSIKMLQLANQSGSLSVVASGRYDLPLDLPAEGPERRSVLVEGCRKLIDSCGFKGRRVVSVLPVTDVRYQNIRIPKMPPDERRQAVEWEATDRLQLGEQDVKVEHLHAGEVRQGDEVRDEIILMAVPDDVLRDHVKVLTDSGLQPIAIDAAPTALSRCFARSLRREADHQVVRVFVDVGLACSKVLIMRGPRVAFFKLVDIGGAKLNASVAEHLDMSVEDVAQMRRRIMHGHGDDEANGEALFGSTRRENVERAMFESIRPVVGELAKEIGLCMRYFSVTFRGSRPDRIHLVGGEAHEPQLAKVMAERLETDVQTFEPLAGVNLSGSQIAIERRGTLPEWAVATGLALRGVGQLVQRGAA